MIENHFVIADDYDSTLFESSQLKKGDIILKIKSESIRDLRQRLKKFIPASNKASFYRDLIKLALRTNKTEMPMVIKRDGQVIELVVKTFPILDLNHLEVRNKSGLSIKPINDSTLYVNFKYADTIKLREAILCNQRLKYFIFDLRSSTKWLVTTLSEFLVKNKNPYAVYYMPLMNKPGYFSEPEILYSEPQKTNHLIQDPRIYILVNENTQSQGEFQTMYLQSIPGSKTIGTKTAGTDGNTFEFKIPGNITIRMTFLGVLYPNFQQTQTNGVNIDHYSPIKIIDFKQGKDPSLNLVMDLIKKGGY
jgi:C-terminal processing protease CtpA/Prc